MKPFEAWTIWYSRSGTEVRFWVVHTHIRLEFFRCWHVLRMLGRWGLSTWSSQIDPSEMCIESDSTLSAKGWNLLMVLWTLCNSTVPARLKTWHRPSAADLVRLISATLPVVWDRNQIVSFNPQPNRRLRWSLSASSLAYRAQLLQGRAQSQVSEGRLDCNGLVRPKFFNVLVLNFVTKVKTNVLIVGQSGEFMLNAGSVSYLWFFGIFDRNSLGDCRADR